MKFPYLISQKLKIALGLMIIIIILLMTNLLTKKHFSDLQKSYSSVYEDRLLVEIHIYKITTFLFDKKILLNKFIEQEDLQIISKNHALNDSIDSRIVAYETTYFTKKETEVFRNLKNHLNQLYSLENSLFNNDILKDKYESLLNINECNSLLSSHLAQLSNIQREEGKREITKSNKLVASSKLTLQFELAILIIIGLIIQALLFAHKSTIPHQHQKSRLN